MVIVCFVVLCRTCRFLWYSCYDISCFVFLYDIPLYHAILQYNMFYFGFILYVTCDSLAAFCSYVPQIMCYMLCDVHCTFSRMWHGIILHLLLFIYYPLCNARVFCCTVYATCACASSYSDAFYHRFVFCHTELYSSISSVFSFTFSSVPILKNFRETNIF